MSVYRVFLGLFIFLCFPCWAQETKHASTLPPAATWAIKDSAQLFFHLRQALKKENENADSAAAYYSQILLSCVAYKYKRGIDSAMMYLHRRFWSRGASSHTWRIMAQALTYTKDIAQPYIVAHVANDLGMFSYYKARYQEAASYFNLALKKLPDTGMAALSFRLAIYNNLGSLWGILHEDDNAISWLRKAEAMAQRLKRHDLLATATVNIGAIYVNKESWDTAFFYCDKALSLAEKHGFGNTFSTASLNLAQISLHKNNPQKAIRYLAAGRKKYEKETAELRQKTLDQKAITPNALLYDQYEGWAYYLNKDYKRAKEKLSFVLDVQKVYGFRNDAMQTAELLAKASAASGDYSQAYENLQYYLSIKDSIEKTEKANAVDVEIKYRTAEKDKAIAQKQLQLSQTQSQLKQKNIFLFSLLGGSVLFIAFMLSLYRNNKHKQKLQNERIRVLQQEHEISNLKSMMEGEEKERVRLARELHDGIMVELSTIKMKLRILDKISSNKAEVSDIISQLDHTTHELRKTAHNLMPDMLLEGGLAEAVFYFCKKMQNENLHISFHQFGDIPRLQQEFEIALYRMVQELVQNIIKHARATQGIVQLSYQNDLLCITVEDNGKGFDARQVSGIEGMGLKSLRARIRALKGVMDVKSSEETGTAVNLEFDIRSVTLNKKQNYAY